jgi:hypothetical protein
MQASGVGEMEAACHCGTVRFRVKLTDGFNTARRCTCSYCRMRGAVAVSADVGGITFDAGEKARTVYRFNTGAAQHYFCSRCGIYTHHRRRSNPNQYGVNVACLKGVSPFDFADVLVIDGVRRTMAAAMKLSATCASFAPKTASPLAELAELLRVMRTG